MQEPRHLDLADRLRGTYHQAVNDGAGPLNGSFTFSRQFSTHPMMHAIASYLESIRANLERVSGQAVCAGMDGDDGTQIMVGYVACLVGGTLQISVAASVFLESLPPSIADRPIVNEAMADLARLHKALKQIEILLDTARIADEVSAKDGALKPNYETILSDAYAIAERALTASYATKGPQS